MLIGTASSSTRRQRGMRDFCRWGGRPACEDRLSRSRRGSARSAEERLGDSERSAPVRLDGSLRSRAAPRCRRPLRRPASGRRHAGCLVRSGTTAGLRGTHITQDPGHGAARLVQRGLKQLIHGERRPRFSRRLRRRLDQALGVRGVRQLLTLTSGASPTASGLQLRTHLLGIQAQTAECRLGHAAGTEQCQDDVLGPDRVVAQPDRFLPRLCQRRFGAFAQGVGFDAGSRVRAQRGLASSMSMIGMPSSTA